VLIGLAIPASVSRSAILATALALAVLIALMPSKQRLLALGAVPVAIAAVFMTAHGLIGTLTSFFEAGTADQSIATRVDDYPMVERLVRETPWFGRGGGTYLPDNAIDILDNQFLKTAIELGLFGVFALAAFFLVPALAALVARRHSRDPELRLLLAALAGSALTATFCSLTFDSLSFPMFTNVHALILGMIGAGWRLVRAEAKAVAPIPTGSFAGPFNHAVQPAGG
jgi:O-antigen ligase